MGAAVMLVLWAISLPTTTHAHSLPHDMGMAGVLSDATPVPLQIDCATCQALGSTVHSLGDQDCQQGAGCAPMKYATTTSNPPSRADWVGSLILPAEGKLTLKSGTITNDLPPPKS